MLNIELIVLLVDFNGFKLNENYTLKLTFEEN